MFKLILITIVVVGIAFLAIGIKMLLVKGGTFKKQCSSTDPKTGKKIGCTCGGGDDGECEN